MIGRLGALKASFTRKAVSTQRAKAKNRDIKVLLLGQAGSGKSTLIKQLQLRYTPEAIERDRPSWRAVVYFTIIKAVRGILDRLWFLLTKNPERGPRIHPYLTLHEVQDDISVMRMRLLPLFTIGDRLATELRGGASPRVELDEIAGVAAQALASLVEDINALWRHGTVRGLVKRRKLKLDESAHYVLNNLRRMCEAEYLPTNDDILNVRMPTVGVTEYSFHKLMGGTLDLKFYDGGARGQRRDWEPYFEDATAVVFLAPVSTFDQFLEENPKVNCFQDSLQLFAEVCANKLLREKSIILLLTKCDVLNEKLNAGIVVKKYISSFSDRPNILGDVMKYFRYHFSKIHGKESSRQSLRRSLYVHTPLLSSDQHEAQHVVSTLMDCVFCQLMTTEGIR